MVTEVVQPVAHWSDTDTFWRSVQILLVPCVDEHWFQDALFVDKCSVASVNAAIDYIRNDVLGSCISEFKIGITENPYVRWHNRVVRIRSEWLALHLLVVLRAIRERREAREHWFRGERIDTRISRRG